MDVISVAPCFFATQHTHTTTYSISSVPLENHLTAWTVNPLLVLPVPSPSTQSLLTATKPLTQRITQDSTVLPPTPAQCILDTPPKMPRNEGLIPSLQRKFWTGVGSAGDTAGNFVHANGRTIQTTARTAAASIDGLGRSVSASGKSANKTGNTYAQALGRQVESYGAAAGKRVGAVGKAVDGSGRAVGGRVGDFGNGVKDVSGARGTRMQTRDNPLGLRGKRTV